MDNIYLFLIFFVLSVDIGPICNIYQHKTNYLDVHTPPRWSAAADRDKSLKVLGRGQS